MTEALDILSELGYTYIQIGNHYKVDTNYGEIVMTESQLINFALEELCQ